jgi:hypothetical protein
MIFTISRYGNDLEKQVEWAEQNVDKIESIVIVAVYEIDLRGFPFTDRLAALNKPLYLMVGSTNQIDLDIPKSKFTEIIYWPTFWILSAYVRLCSPINKETNQGYGYFHNKIVDINHKPQKLFITMNKAPKFHRAMFMDLLYHNNMFDKGYLIFRELSNYPFKYWQQEVLLLDQKDSSVLFNQEVVPQEYTKALFQIVTESHENYFFLTEKTAIPLLFQKPFLVVGDVNYHKTLESLGFVLYTELFDYSFDTIVDMEERYNCLINGIKDIDLNFNLDKIKDKLIHNKKLAIHYATDINGFPKLWNKLAEEPTKHLLPDPYHLNNIVKNDLQ